MVVDTSIFIEHLRSREQAGKIFRHLRKTGQMIEISDILIAATALANDLPVKTLNQRHFSRIDGLILL